ncbi:hydrogenase maturation protein HypF [Gordonibacter sp. An230]|uniref:carbamoyltransferase HypF n=1 Tax=Gordonibacter sp. An230 TaxID=1965592 RepID=UPI000B3890E7|nr:carbamoyltransferase HypF [Gordonibacter sp. An230]OUO86558.1 hydrogenase maturation protein HypF [Gordonibacter sp. An230]
MIEALDIQVKGIVQGVGFRPFVYRAAKKCLVDGWVLNAADGVFIHAEGEGKLLDEFVLELSENAPAAARVEEISLKEVPLEGFDSFEIRFSDGAAVEKTTLVSPDLATCDDCVRELFDPNDRRYRYPFINCTNCGPRFTIIEKLPYDRASTSMSDFPLCELCASEYGDPLDRRFHAQPNACFACGPHVSWREHEGGDASAPLGPTSWGATRQESDAIFARAVELLAAGGIVAMKGLGGFHLVCDANNPEAVAKLRARKRREGKAFAVMAASLDDVRRVCEVGEAEAGVLTGTQRPIVLLRKRPDATFAPGLADDLPELGVMLPYTPMQHLLLRDFADAAKERGCNLVPMLVMTSGNMHDEPIVVDDERAYGELFDIADAFLGHNRAIRTRYDDSVVRVVSAGGSGTAVQFIRRARGYAPLPLPLAPSAAVGSSSCDRAPDALAREGEGEGKGEAFGVPSFDGSSCDARGAASGASALDGADFAAFSECAAESSRVPACASRTSAKVAAKGGAAAGGAGTGAASGEGASVGAIPSVFAAGSEQKNTFTLTRDAEAFVSQHIGDMENAETYDAWLAAKGRYEALFEISPTLLACDLHPEYLASKWARERSSECGLPLVEVQHHHAHVVSAMAEHGLDGPVCGIAFDGTGYGVDGAIWGGEVLLANRTAFERFANFAYVPMPGGAAAVRHPLRMAYGALWAFDLLDHPGAARALEGLGEQAAVCDQMIERGINTPQTSSVGRLFDAASALLGICTEPAYEGEPAILLEAAIGAPSAGRLSESACAVCPDAAHRDSSSSGQAHVSHEACGAERGEGGGAAASERYGVAVLKNTATASSTAQDTSVVLFDAAPTFAALLDDLAADVPISAIARRFHDAFVQAIVTAAELVRAMYGIETVVLSGGVFMNRYLLEHSLVALEAAGFTVAINRDLPPNDGCISFGQAVVAWAANGEGVVKGDA